LDRDRKSARNKAVGWTEAEDRACSKQLAKKQKSLSSKRLKTRKTGVKRV